MEAKAKKACSLKLNRLLENARAIHKNSITEVSGESETTFGRALLCFTKSTDHKEDVGGKLWAWRKISEEGIWLSTHLLAGNLAQFTICLFLASFFIGK
jgi:hypothetical protein